MKQMLIVLSCVGVVMSGSAFAQSGYPAKPKAAAAGAPAHRLMDDRAFVQSLADGGFADVELGRLGLARASRADVRQFAQRIVDTGVKMNDDLKPLLASQGLSAPSEIDARHKLTRDWLAKLGDEAFDRAYMAAMTAKYANDVTFVQRAMVLTREPAVQAWTSRVLPALKEHQAVAAAITRKQAEASPTTKRP